MLAEVQSDFLKIFKNYKQVQSAQNIILADHNRVEMSFNKASRELEAFHFDFGIKSDDSLIAIDARQRVKFQRKSYSANQPVVNVIKEKKLDLQLSSVDDGQYRGTQSRKSMMEDILGSTTKEELLELTSSLENEQDYRISEALNKLEALPLSSS